MPFDQRLQFAIAELYSLQSDAMYKRLVSNVRMKHPNATFQGIEYVPQRNLDLIKLTQLSTGDFLTHEGNILVYGATGSGSSHGSGGLTCSSSTNGLETNSLKARSISFSK